MNKRKSFEMQDCEFCETSTPMDFMHADDSGAYVCYQCIAAATEDSLKIEKEKHNKAISKIRASVADFITSCGCGCCSNPTQRNTAEGSLGKMLRVKKYKDGSGYDFAKYQTK